MSENNTISKKQRITPKATTNDNIPVFCSHDEIVPTANLRENPLNPNKHPDKQIELLADIIERTGWRQPITVSNRSGCIVKGHGRLYAAKFKGWSNVPVDYQDYNSQDEEYADLIADNRLAELSEIQEDMLAEILRQFEDHELMALTGYDDEEIDSILASMIDDEEEEEPEEEEKTPDTTLTKAGDTWSLGEHRLIIGEEDPNMDALLNTYVYQTGNIGCTCVRDGKEYGYVELVSAWAAENNMEKDVFTIKKPVTRRK